MYQQAFFASKYQWWMSLSICLTGFGGSTGSSKPFVCDYCQTLSIRINCHHQSLNYNIEWHFYQVNSSYTKILIIYVIYYCTKIFPSSFWWYISRFSSEFLSLQSRVDPTLSLRGLSLDIKIRIQPMLGSQHNDVNQILTCILPLSIIHHNSLHDVRKPLAL